MKKKLSCLFCLSMAFLLSCGDEQKPAREIQPQDIREPLIRTNKRSVRKEADEIDQYIKYRGWEMKATGTGLRYMIYEKGSGEQANVGMLAKVNYKISLLDGTVCYTSDETGPKEILIGQDHVESGLHEALALMKRGDKAVFILPSHLAHGLLGDADKIPPQSSVIYDIELIALRHP